MSENTAEKLDTDVLDRIVIVGTCGSGKSTLADKLVRRSGAPHIELDGLHHAPNWSAVPIEIFRERVAEQTAGKTWVVDGNYIDLVSDMLWNRAGTIIWLDIPLTVILPRIIRRSLGRIIRRTELWAGNKETFGGLLGRKSLVRWAITSHRRHRRELPLRLSPPRLTGVSVVRLRSSAEADRWLAGLPTQPLAHNG